MKKSLLLIACFMTAMLLQAQTTSFRFTTPEGFTLFCRVSDPVNKKVVIERDPTAPPAYSPPSIIPHYVHIHIPGIVTHDGEVYTVTTIDQHGICYIDTDKLTFDDDIDMGWQPIETGDGIIKSLYFPKNLTRVPDNFGWYAMNGHIETVWLNPALKRIESFALWGIKHLKGFADSPIEEIRSAAFNLYGTPDMVQDLAVLPQTIRILESQCFGYSPLPLDKLVIPLSMETVGSGVYDISDDVYISHTSPFTLGSNAFGSQSTMKIHVPVDCSAAFGAAANWSTYAGQYREEVTIGPNGYRSYYLENENFEVPTGCTAYIITGVTQRGTEHIGDATVVAFDAGKVIPKKTGFILKGMPNTTVTYRANVAEPEVSVAGNLLVGTATEHEFSEAGYKFYLFGKGAQGQGFYHQGVRNGNSVRLDAHRAGLRLPAGSGDFAPAKGIFIDFESATHGTVTAITSPAAQTGKTQETIVYDLQGRRVTNPTHGIYIVNGKKVVIK